VTQPFKTLKELTRSLEKDLLQGHDVLSVFDLDSTLFDVSPRIQQILEELKTHPEILERFPEHASLLEHVKTQRNDWGIKDALTRVFRQNPPPMDFHRVARDFWAQHFFSNEYLHFDHLVEGSQQYVNHLFKQGSQIAYLTGRDWHRMGIGTVEVLKKWNFPVPNEKNVKLAMKPVKGADDSEFKSGWFESLNASQFKRIVFFENEPVIIHDVAKKHPHIEIVFLDTTHSGKAKPVDHWMTIQNFVFQQQQKV
jgi:hypothetical protein